MNGSLHRYLQSHFDRQIIGATDLYLKAELSARSASVLDILRQLVGDETRWKGNRQSIAYVKLDGIPELVVRRGRRGGWVSPMVQDIYLGFRPRQFVELAVATKAFSRSLPVAEPVGAIVEWLAPGIYRGYYLTRKESGCTLWEFVQKARPRSELLAIFKQVRHALDELQRAGLYHRDLTLHNFFVTNRGRECRVLVLDLDRARFTQSPLSSRLQERNRRRLLRSVRKLDPLEKIFDDEALCCLGLHEKR